MPRSCAGCKSFYYDLALSSSDPVVALLDQVVGTDRLVFGSDYPQVPENYIQATADVAFHSKAISTEQCRQIVRGNGLTLLPRLQHLVKC